MSFGDSLPGNAPTLVSEMHPNPVLKYPIFFELYQKLVAEGRIDTNKIDFYGDTPFIFAARCVINNGAVLSIVKFLL